MPRNDLKAYTSVIARLPQALADQVKHYASEHGCSVSDLIRAGLELRLAADVPARTPDMNRDSEVLHKVLHRVEALGPMLRAQIQDTVRATMPEVLQEVLQGHTEVLQLAKVLQGHTSVPKSLEDTSSGGSTEVVPHAEVIQGYTSAALQQGHTEVLPYRDEVLQGYTEEGSTEVVPRERGGMTEVVPYDTTKYHLGKLCPRKHEWGNTGKSLLNAGNQCLQCRRENKRAKDARKRQAKAAIR